MKIRRFRTLAILLATVALIAAACGSSAEVAVDVEEAPAEEGAEATEAEVAEEPTEEVIEEEVAEEAAEEVVEETAAPQPVTASTVPETTSDDFPDILAAQATPTGDGTWRFDVTVSSTYDTPERYADAWRVVGPDGTEYGIRVLAHDHAGEQPFTRSQTGIVIPPDVTTVTIEGRDLANGWGGGFLVVNLAGE